MPRRTTLSFGADTSELDAAFAHLNDELAGFAAGIEAMSAALAASSAGYRQQDAGSDQEYWQSLIEHAEAASAARTALDQQSAEEHRDTARQWQAIDTEFGRDFSDVAMAAITHRRGGVEAALAEVARHALSQALAGIGRGIAGQFTSMLGLNDVSLTGLLGLGGGANAGATAMQQLNETMAAMGLTTEGLDVTTAANTVATTANTAAESAGGAAGGAGLLGLLGFAGGGRPAPGMPSIVGESGPELFVPDAAGTVLPNGGWGLHSPQASASGGSGDFAPSISVPVAFHGGGASMSKAEFRRMLSGHVDYLMEELKNPHRNSGRRVRA